MAYKLNKCPTEAGKCWATPIPTTWNESWFDPGYSKQPRHSRGLQLPAAPPRRAGSKAPISLVVTDISTSFDTILLCKDIIK